MSNIKIDKNIPLPPMKRGKAKTYKYPFQTMEIGDSFVFNGISNPTAFSTASRYGKLLGKKFTTRREGDGVRCWRIA